jgi:hypothetical protein
MAKRVVFTDRAKADLRAIPREIAIQILHTLARFLNAEEGDVKRLQEITPPLYRLRAQDHHVMFRNFGSHIEVTRAFRIVATPIGERARRTQSFSAGFLPYCDNPGDNPDPSVVVFALP